jgi:hypothetical protein
VAQHESSPPRDNPRVAHEGADVNVKAIAGFALSLVIITLVVHLALYWLLDYYGERQARLQEPLTLIEPTDEPPPAPRLEVAPRAALAELRAAEDRNLQGYGWVDREKKIVRIPIRQAMEIIAEKGLPVRKEQPREEKSAGDTTRPAKAKDLK